MAAGTSRRDERVSDAGAVQVGAASHHPIEDVLALAEHRGTTPGCGIAGVHVYPLGGLKKSARWCHAAAAGQLVLNARGDGFRVDAELD